MFCNIKNEEIGTDKFMYTYFRIKIRRQDFVCTYFTSKMCHHDFVWTYFSSRMVRHEFLRYLSRPRKVLSKIL